MSPLVTALSPTPRVPVPPPDKPGSLGSTFHRLWPPPRRLLRRRGLSQPSFYFWKRRLTAEAADSGAYAGAEELRTRPQPIRLAVELALPGGLVVRLVPSCDLAFIRALVAALGSLPC